MHHFEIIKALRLLGSTVDILGCGETAFKEFAQLVDWIFELSRRHSKSSAYIEALGDVNVDVTHNLICQHEEFLNTKLALETELIEMNLEISLEHQNEQATQLQQSRIDAKEALLPQIGSTRLSMKAQER
ncbi:hypothetical protein L3X38_042894 [Prunus dulcis]|uniref:Uncharacterized protein n=1 Tax=Prunus dulcis TaxID=3755 RepID=A0AAD4YME5_PRUDU|nr:hypothetical protein L3X38_042894 [Prunus dulcis]